MKYNYLLYPFAFLYASGICIRNFLYDLSILKSVSFSKPITIGIGNITVGGTGKTPMSEYLIELLREEFNVGFLSRGYGRHTRGFRIVKPYSEAYEVGDEPLQIAKKYPDIFIAVSENRVEGIKKLIAFRELDVVVLDDVFQHRRINPTVNILLTSYNRLFFKDKFLPVGRLRDCKKQYKRADIIIITKSPSNLTKTQAQAIIDELKPYDYQYVHFTTIAYEKPQNFEGRLIDIKDLADYHTLLITGIADSHNLVDFLYKKTNLVHHFKFADHHFYNENDIQNILEVYENIKAEKKIILTTEKDFVKLNSLKISYKLKQNIYFLPIKVKFLFNLHTIFNRQIKSYVRKNSTNSFLFTG